MSISPRTGALADGAGTDGAGLISGTTLSFLMSFRPRMVVAGSSSSSESSRPYLEKWSTLKTHDPVSGRYSMNRAPSFMHAF